MSETKIMWLLKYGTKKKAGLTKSYILERLRNSAKEGATMMINERRAENAEKVCSLNYEEMYNEEVAKCEDLCVRLEDMEEKAAKLAVEYSRYKAIVKTFEFIYGRKFDAI